MGMGLESKSMSMWIGVDEVLSHAAGAADFKCFTKNAKTGGNQLARQLSRYNTVIQPKACPMCSCFSLTSCWCTATRSRLRSWISFSFCTLRCALGAREVASPYYY